MSKIHANWFYESSYHGHHLEDLNNIIGSLRSYNKQNKNRSVIFLAGDSSLDNKHWPLNDFNEKKLCNKPPINGYEDVLKTDTSLCVPDVAYQINQTLIENGLDNEYVCINAAIEATTLHQRFTETNYSGDIKLLPQDKFIYNNIRPDDILIVSVGGNDIALNALPETTRHFQNFIINSKKSEDEKNKDEISSYKEYFRNIFNDKMKLYITKLCSRDGNDSLPSVIIPCMVYYPALTLTQSGFANKILNATNYRTGKQEILQNFIKDLYLESTINIYIENINKTNIIDPCPLYEVLDSSNSKLYLKSVEPSIEGGKLMAARFVDQIKIYKYIRSYFKDNINDLGYSMIYFRLNFNDEHGKKFKILINQLLTESNKLNHSKKDKYYHSELKIYINIILNDNPTTDDILLIKNNKYPTQFFWW
jgi:hypothetical protein